MVNKPDSSRLLDIIESFEGLKVAIYGDFVLDEFIYGEISRVSREAPVLILDFSSSTVVPGGGANSVNNIKALDAIPVPVGIVGNDEAGSKLLEILKKRKIDTTYVKIENGFATPVKTRILAGSAHTTKQQVIRLDRGSKNFSLAQASLAAMKKRLTKAIAASDGLLIADYNHGSVDAGLCMKILASKKKARHIVTLDSRKRILEFKGVTAATPNEEEVEHALDRKIGNDEKALRSGGVRLLKAIRAQALLITRGSKGMSLFAQGRHISDIPVHGTDEVADVTGAGDTVISTFTLSLMAGACFHEAAIIANYAGGIVVMKRGTATISRKELAEAIGSDHSHS